MKTIHDFANMYRAKEKITMVTCYDFTLARLVNQSQVDCVLVGDSGAMVMQGESTTVPATLDMIVGFVIAVSRGLTSKLLIADLPFLTYRQGVVHHMKAVQRLVQAGAQAVKLEGAVGNLSLIEHTVTSGVPVMGHLGLTPQRVHELGGFKVQGRNHLAAEILKKEAKQLQEAGCFAVVLECIPATLAKEITDALSIPTIGIGAGPDTSGQVLVLQDLLGLTDEFQVKFVKRYFDGAGQVTQALNQYATDVKLSTFPDEQHSW